MEDQNCQNEMDVLVNASDVLGETTVGVHQSGKVYTAISKQSDVCHSTARKIIRKWKT